MNQRRLEMDADTNLDGKELNFRFFLTRTNVGGIWILSNVPCQCPPLNLNLLFYHILVKVSLENTIGRN